MALPKIESPTFELELPSTGEKLKARPFLVKEQKHLLIAQESENTYKLQYQKLSMIVHLKRFLQMRFLCLMLNICS